jgi:hypothetical protein
MDLLQVIPPVPFASVCAIIDRFRTLTCRQHYHHSFTRFLFMCLFVRVVFLHKVLKQLVDKKEVRVFATHRDIMMLISRWMSIIGC